jgi:hypothetical protein
MLMDNPPQLAATDLKEGGCYPAIFFAVGIKGVIRFALILIDSEFLVNHV